MPKKKPIAELSPPKKKLREKIRRWAYMDAKKHPRQFAKLFRELYFPETTREC